MSSMSPHRRNKWIIFQFFVPQFVRHPRVRLLQKSSDVLLPPPFLLQKRVRLVFPVLEFVPVTCPGIFPAIPAPRDGTWCPAGLGRSRPRSRTALPRGASAADNHPEGDAASNQDEGDYEENDDEGGTRTPFVLVLLVGSCGVVARRGHLEDGSRQLLHDRDRRLLSFYGEDSYVEKDEATTTTSQ